MATPAPGAPSNPLQFPADVAVEDGSAFARAAWDCLTRERAALNIPRLEIRLLDEYLRDTRFEPLPPGQKAVIAGQAQLMFEKLYAHRQFKEAVYSSARPVETFAAIQAKGDTLADAEFHTAMMRAAKLAFDTHSIYGAPQPYRGSVAFLPFQVRAFRDQLGRPTLAVTAVLKTTDDGTPGHPDFVPGAIVTHWNGEPAVAHILANCDRFPSGDPDNQLARGAVMSTICPLTYCPPPGDLGDTLHYLAPGSNEIQAIRLPWAVATGIGASASLPHNAFSVSPGLRHTVDAHEEVHATALGPSPFLIPPASGAGAAGQPDLSRVSALPEVFRFQYTGGTETPGAIDPVLLDVPGHPGVRLGYIRIREFSEGPNATAREFRRILTLMNEKAPDGLILDVRGNPGGDVRSAEMLTQMLTDTEIQPLRFHLPENPAVRELLRGLREWIAQRASLTPEQAAQLASASADLQPWLDETDQGFAEDPLGDGHTLTLPEDANSIGRVYQGQSVLLTDCLTYSAAEAFAASYQDHHAGTVIGVDPQTGGGGGNVWTHQELLRKLPSSSELPLASLPDGVTLTIAFRRYLRTGLYRFTAVEDHGVMADLNVNPTTVAELLGIGDGAIRRACRILACGKTFRMAPFEEKWQPGDGGLQMTYDCENIDLISVQVEEEPPVQFNVPEPGPFTCTVPVTGSYQLPLIRTSGYAMLPDVRDGGYATLPGSLKKMLVCFRVGRSDRPV